MKKASAIIVQLIHIHGPLKGTIQEFNKNTILIGRHSTCDVKFPGEAATISRQHATIKREGNRFQIIDNSANGLFVNGKREKEAFLKDGDVLIFSQGGPKVSFLTRVDQNAEIPDETQNNPLDNHHLEKENLAVPEIHIPPDIQHQPVNEPPAAPIQSWNNNIKPQDNPAVQNYQAQVQPSPMADNPVIEETNVPLIVQFGAMLQSFKVLPITIGKNENSDFILNHPLV
ncbi:MAG: FHA domain-containing protein, partial [Desulfobacula sp.]|nr:FHA domain-containing protein [Desulfobacula sp.]